MANLSPGTVNLPHLVPLSEAAMPGEALLMDFRNGLISINKESMFEEQRQQNPSLSAWMESCYSQPLHLGLDTIHSCCGVQQEDPGSTGVCPHAPSSC